MSVTNGQPLSVEQFRNILSTETKILNQHCEKWASVLEEAGEVGGGGGGGGAVDGPQQQDDNQQGPQENEEFLGAIRSTIGQAKLLMSQRFKQFSDLIDHCEFQTGQIPTRLNDLSGFWDMISFQVEDVLQKFEKLDKQQYKQSIGEFSSNSTTSCQKQ